MPGIAISILAILVFGVFILYSCKKETDETPSPDYWVRITSPESWSVFQASENILFEAEMSGFGDSSQMHFSSGDLINVTIDGPPYQFNWSIPAMLADTIIVNARASRGNIEASDSILIYIIDTITPNIKPVAVLDVMPAEGNIDTIFFFDASQSRDTSTAFEDLLFRFDFDGDGEWDTDFSNEYQQEFKYNQVGSYDAVLEVKDTDNLVADTSVLVKVQHGGGPDPCEGYYSVPYAGKIYHLLRIGKQCWMRENLDVGTMIMGGEEQANNSIIEKYCYDNDSMNCVTYGGLYKWKEAMNHIFPIGTTRGICPDGYHIPTDAEWMTLEAYADSQYEPLDDVWKLFGFRGFDAGKRLKAMLGWTAGGNGNNLTGFKALAAGYWDDTDGFQSLGEITYFSGTNHNSGAENISRGLSFEEDGISRSYKPTVSAFSIRCIRD